MRFLCRHCLFLIFIGVLTFSFAAEPPAKLPPLSEVLAEAKTMAAMMPKDVSQGYLYRRIASLQGRALDIPGAFATLDAIELEGQTYGQTAKNLSRVGFFELVETLSRCGQAPLAIQTVKNAPEHYQEHGDEAYGRIAVVQSEKGGAGTEAKATLKLMKNKTAYRYELDVAINLNDPAWGKELLQETIKAIDNLEEKDLKFFSRESYRALLYELSLLVWCGERDAARRYVQKLKKVAKLSEEELGIFNKITEGDAPDLRCPQPCAEKEKAVSLTEQQLLEKYQASKKIENINARGEALLELAALMLRANDAATEKNDSK